MDNKNRPQKDWLLLKHPKELLVLMTAVVITVSAWFVSTYLVEKNRQDAFKKRTTEISDAIQTRMGLYEQVLWGGVGFMEASDFVSRREWKIYVDSLKLAQLWPGIQGFGYSVPVPSASVNDHIAGIREEGFPDYKIMPEGERESYTAIIYLEPFDWRNQRAFGYDMWSSPMRRAAMAKARDTGHAAISGRITLVQETDTDVQAGFLMYTPVYRMDMPLTSQEERVKAFEGWVYSAFRMGDLMKGILGPTQDDLDFAVYDSVDASEHSMLFSTSDDLLNINASSVVSHSIALQGRDWTVLYRARAAAPNDIETMIPNIIVLAGILVDLLIYYLMITMISTSHQANEIAAKKTKELEEATQAAEKANKAKSVFLSSMSHELRSPLNSIIAYAQLCLTEKTEPPLAAATRDNLTTIMTSGQHLMDLIGNILDVSKIEAGGVVLEETNFSLSEVIEEVVSMMTLTAKEKGNSLSLDLASNMPAMLTGDSVKIRQIVLNLVSNAVKFTENGNIYVRSRLQNVSKGMASFRIEVADNGIGIAKHKQGTLFEAFTQADMSTTRKYGGTGLGLNISRSLLDAMGGTISFISEEGEGSTFWFEVSLPVCNDRVNEKAEEGTADIATQPLHILLVEDIEINRIVTRKLLENEGYTVSCANDGEEAVAAVNASGFDIILMDIHMPNMDGIDATKAIRNLSDPRKNSIPIIALTADINAENIEVYKKAGMASHCSKPLKMPILKRLITNYGTEPKPQPSATVPQKPAKDLHTMAINMEQFNMCATHAPEAITGFDAEIEKIQQKLPDYIKNGDIKALGSAIHSVKGMALNLGYSELADLCGLISARCKTAETLSPDDIKRVEAASDMMTAYSQQARSLVQA